jgi:K+-transporting ATPase ATPase C chain
MLKTFVSAIRPALVMTAGFALLLGGAYPLLVTGIAQALFPHEANGSLIRRNGAVIGSELLAQGFAAPRYFHPRPSAAHYDAGASAGSNLGPASQGLAERIGQATAALRATSHQEVPPEMVTTSASGLDPHISPEAAFYQVEQVALARHVPKAQVMAMVQARIERAPGGLPGEALVNVLKLNLALDDAFGSGA